MRECPTKVKVPQGDTAAQRVGPWEPGSCRPIPGPLRAHSGGRPWNGSQDPGDLLLIDLQVQVPWSRAQALGSAPPVQSQLCPNLKRLSCVTSGQLPRPPKPLLPLLENERNNQKASLRGFLRGWRRSGMQRAWQSRARRNCPIKTKEQSQSCLGPHFSHKRAQGVRQQAWRVGAGVRD